MVMTRLGILLPGLCFKSSVTFTDTSLRRLTMLEKGNKEGYLSRAMTEYAPDVCRDP
jgi:hypothetical protein